MTLQGVESMHPLLKSIRIASTWPDYLKAFETAYAEMCLRRWCLGDACGVQRVHHTSTPDIGGHVFGATNWALYSQPSSRSLSSFLKVFGEAVMDYFGGPRRHRFAFLAVFGSPLSREQAQSALGNAAGYLDFWCDSIESALDLHERWAVLDSVNFWFARGEAEESRRVFADMPIDMVWSKIVEALRPDFISMANIDESTVPKQLRSVVVDSSFILDGVRAGCTPEHVRRTMGSNCGLAARHSLDRARKSGWSDSLVLACERIVEIAPLRTRAYCLRPGDTLSRIIRHQYGQPFSEIWPLLAPANPTIVDVNRVRAGQIINLVEFEDL